MGKYMCMDTLRFLLFEVHGADSLTSFQRFAGHDTEAFSLLLDAVKEWADKDFYPYYREMDANPAHFKNGKVHTHPILKKIFKDAGDNGWLGMYFEKEDGGIQLPHLIQSAVNHILESANNHIPGYLGLTAGAAHLIATYGSEELKVAYIPHMLSGKWGGTMALTEPQAGSSLSDITTTATHIEGTTYSIRGQKIFISAGDHESVDNNIHLTLARIQGAPAGTKGISLFVVPKLRPGDEGNFIHNHVEAVADFQKMGQRGYSTVHLVFGENNPCHGYLVGEPHMGLKYMFQLMNGARIDVGMTAASVATAAYYASLQYAAERPQGRKILNSGKKDVSTGQTIIKEHPDVRRMLLMQKSIVEGALSLVLECAKLADESLCTDNPAAKDSHLLLELLTPVAKTFPAELGRQAVDQGLQVLGGYGFCTDFPLQQYLRDIRIMAIYEGTTGIQSLDLMSRKLPMEGGQALRLLVDRMEATMQEAHQHEALKPYADQLKKAMADVQTTLMHQMNYAMKGEYDKYLADATLFMELFGRTVVAWQWLKTGCRVVRSKNEGTTGLSASFYEGKWKAMEYFFIYELSKVSGLMNTILSETFLTLPVEEGDDWLYS